MNRRVQWNQTPPNMNDFDPECLKAPGPLQQQSAIPEDEATGERKPKRASSGSTGPTPNPKAPKLAVENEAEGLVVTKLL